MSDVIKKDIDLLMIMPSIGYMDDGRSAHSLPLSILHAVSLVGQSYSVKILDQRLEKNFWSLLQQELNKKPRLIGVTTWTGPMLRNTVQILAYVRKNSSAPIVLGGIHPSLMPKETIQSQLVDFVICGEGEYSLLKLLENLDGKITLEAIPGIWYRDHNGVIIQTLPSAFLDLNELPKIPYGLLDIQKYVPLYQGKRTLSMETSRGCPFACRYCYQRAYNRGSWRFKNSERVCETVNWLKNKYNIENIYFVDDNFFIDLSRGLNIANGFERLNMTYEVQGVDIFSLKQMDDGYLKKLEISGLRRLTVGVETVSDRLRHFLNKPGKKEDILNILHRLKPYEFTIFCNFFGGYPEETKDDIKENIRFILEALKMNPKIRISPYYMYVPFPGTLMYDKYVSDGLFVPPSTFEAWKDFSWEGNPFLNKMGKKKIKLYKSLYFLSLFVDNKATDYLKSPLKRFAATVYRFFAKFRLKKFYFDYMPELIFYNRLFK